MATGFLLQVDSPAIGLLALCDGFSPEAGQTWLHDTLLWLKRQPIAMRTGRLRLIAETIESHPRRDELRRCVRKIWCSCDPIRMLSEAGVPEAVSFFQEASERIADRLIPRLDEWGDLYAVIESIQPDEEDARWLDSLPPEDVAYWEELLDMPQGAIETACRIVALRAASVAISSDIATLAPGSTRMSSPFFELPEAVTRYSENPGSEAARSEWNQVHSACTAFLRDAHAALEHRGVSTNLVFRLNLLESQLLRLATLLKMAAGDRFSRTFAVSTIRGIAQDRSLVNFVRRSITRLARKMVEQTGRAGEHYIAEDRRTWRMIGWRAMGAGAITSLTALFKAGIGSLPLAPMLIGAGHWLNYSSSFIAMLLLRFPLASKMPAMTAASLAHALEHEESNEEEISLIAAICRTQLIVTLCNLAATIPLSLVIDGLWRWQTGHPFLTLPEAEHGVAGLHPLRSPTVIYALITGVFLWLSSMAAGWTANWMAYRHLPQAIAANRNLRRFAGSKRARRLAAFVENNLGGIAGYMVLGFELGFLPVVAEFAGVPFEVRHVTLAAASLAYDISALLSFGMLHPDATLWAVAGVAVTGVCNVGAAFALGLWVAMRSRNLTAASRHLLWVQVRQEVLRNPRRFLLPESRVREDRLDAVGR